MPSHRIQLEDVMHLPSVYFPATSFDGNHLAFYWDKTGQMELYVIDLPDGAPRQISAGNVPRSLRAGFIWSRDGARIVFAKDVGGNEQHDLYGMDVASGEASQLTDTPTAQDYPVEFSPGDVWISMFSNRDGQLNLYKLRSDGSEAIRLTDFANPVSGGHWSPDGKQLAIETNEAKDLRNRDIYVVDADGSQCQRVLQVKEGSKENAVGWLPDGRRLAVTSDASGVNQPGILDIASGSVQWLGIEGVEESAATLSENGKKLATLRNQDASVTVVIYNLETGAEQVLGSESGFAIWPEFALEDRYVVMAQASATRHRELLSFDLATGEERTLTPVDYGPIDTSVFVHSRYVRYASTDGLSIPAILYTPENLPEEETAPAVVIIHGGPTGQFFRGFDPFAQVLVDRGYVVLQPNVRGSTGYGVEFRDMNLNDWAGGDLEDVAAGVEFLKSLGIVDPTRIVAFGGSYGGYMTFMAVVKKPDLWKAGVAWIGITDLHRLYEKSMEHFKYYLRTLMGDPEENAELWRDRSAINFVENLNAKLLILHGVNDPRCPIEQSRIFRDRMLELGYKEGEDFEYIEFTDVGHASSDMGQKTETYRIIADFLDRAV